MDPTVCWNEIMELLDQLTRLLDAERMTPYRLTEAEAPCHEIQRKLYDLRGWLDRGGFPPKQWEER